MHRSSLIL